MKFHLRTRELASYISMGINTYWGRILVQASFLLAAVLTGVAAVEFMDFVSQVQMLNRIYYHDYPYIMTALTPLCFFLGAAVVKYLAPHAGGSGVPQVLYVCSLSNSENQNAVQDGLLSMRTAIVKVISVAFGMIGGATLGGEGPTVQISGTIFATIGSKIRKYYPDIDFRSYIIAAAGGGIAAAFNTPLGGITFAIEEFAGGDFGELRHGVMLAVVVAGLTAQAVMGDHFYFGKVVQTAMQPEYILWAIFIGAGSGLLGGISSRMIASQRFYKAKINWWQRSLICGVVVAAINFAYKDFTSGAGYIVTHDFLIGKGRDLPLSFPVAKMFGMVFSALSGMGGGILAPAISIGAWTGVSIGKIAALSDLSICAILGMSGYFAGAFQIPITSVIIVMEMTNKHEFIIPMMIAALTGVGVGKLIMPESLYHTLIKRSYEKSTLSD